ncbi:hypothetical protein OOT46_02555 [Aquabacterium sp. A7-Y]|uniref:hypothetical protein n=1 Tax=Aquabacterium sp. A7-Y TaxID=1349605 RepID=UPI00223E68D5|nr:hypothetical protein [Aquabacterium sp. A7-Y]MCW7536735.1 hypothetical protein [Aquabacterium sp. A7-Y]
MLADAAYFGAPETFKKVDGEAGIGTRKGVVSFWNIPGYYLNGTGGHIDIVAPSIGTLQTCGSGCFWNSSKVCFWPLA